MGTASGIDRKPSEEITAHGRPPPRGLQRHWLRAGLVSGGSYGTTNIWEVATGRHLLTLFTFPESQKGTVRDDWLAYSPEDFYDGSPGVERYLAWRVGDDLKTPDSVGTQLHRPDKIEAALRAGLPKSRLP